MSTDIRRAIVTFVLTVLSCVSLPVMSADSAPLDLRFSDAAPGRTLPPGWLYHALSRKAHADHFAVVDDDGASVLQATADDAAGMVVHALDLPPSTRLAWHWTVDHAVVRGNLARRSGDDFAARVYVFFDLPDSALGFGARIKLKLARLIYGADLPAAALCYVWANRAPVGTIAPSAFTAQVKMIVLESGDDHAGTWRAESRDLAADYRAAFHSTPPRINAVVLASDTDNTHGSVRAWFGDLALTPTRVQAPHP